MFKKALVLTFFLLFFILNINIISADFSFTDFLKQKITDLPKELHEMPSLDYFEDNIHIIWKTTTNKDEYEINYVKSIDNGKNWSNPVNLASNISIAEIPVIAVNNNSVHVVWKDYRLEYPEIYYIRSLDNGQTWEKEKRLTFDSNRLNTIYDINLVSDNNYLYLVWKDYRSGSSEIFFKNSNDNGNTWTEDIRLTTDYKPSYSPRLKVDLSNLYISYEEWGNVRASICILKSNDYGNTWSNKKYLTDNSSDGNSKHSDIDSYKDNIYIVWQDDRTNKFEIFFKKSQDYGQTWSDSIQITSNCNNSVNPKIYSNKNNVVVFWIEERNNFFNILYKNSSDYGLTWSETKSLVNDQNCYDFELIGLGENINFIWQEYHEPNWADIWYMSNLNYNLTSEDVIDIPINTEIRDSVQNTPGLGIFLIIFAFIFVFFVIRRYK